MGTVRVGISDPVDHGHFALIPKGLYRSHVRVEAEVIVYRQNLIRRDTNDGAVIIVEAVAIRNHRVERIIRSN